MGISDFETFTHCCAQCSSRNTVQGRNSSHLLRPNQQCRERCFGAYLSLKKGFCGQEISFSLPTLLVGLMNKITFLHNICPLVPPLPHAVETRERKGRKVISLSFFSLFIQVSST